MPMQEIGLSLFKILKNWELQHEKFSYTMDFSLSLSLSFCGYLLLLSFQKLTTEISKNYLVISAQFYYSHIVKKSVFNAEVHMQIVLFFCCF